MDVPCEALRDPGAGCIQTPKQTQTNKLPQPPAILLEAYFISFFFARICYRFGLTNILFVVGAPRESDETNKYEPGITILPLTHLTDYS